MQADYKIEDYDFLDFGSKDGSSMAFATVHLGGKRGLGVEINPSFAQRARDKGYACLTGDATCLELPDKCVRFVILSHFLEHLPDRETARKILATAVRVSREFIYLCGPCFDQEAYLMERGLKLCFWDWDGHTFHHTTAELRAILQELGAINPQLQCRMPVTDSSYEEVLPLDMPAESMLYNSETDINKPYLCFDAPVYQEFYGVIQIDPQAEMPVVQLPYDMSFFHSQIQSQPLKKAEALCKRWGLSNPAAQRLYSVLHPQLANSATLRVKRFDDNLFILPTETFVGGMFTTPEGINHYVKNIPGDLQECLQRLWRELQQDGVLPDRPGMRILEVGAGTGNATLPALSVFREPELLVVNDISPAILQVCRKYLSQELPSTQKNDHIIYLAADISASEVFQEESFDLIFGNAILHHLVQPEDFVRSLHRLLKPGGKAFFYEPFLDPYLSIVFFIQLDQYMAVLANQAYPPEIENKLNSYCNYILGHSDNTFSLDDLKKFDDKHLFRDEDFLRLGEEMGFGVIIKRGSQTGDYAQIFRQIYQALDLTTNDRLDTVASLFSRVAQRLYAEYAPYRAIIIERTI